MTRRKSLLLAPEAISRILRAQREWLGDRFADGSLECVYAFAEGAGGVAIVNARTPEELNGLLSASPLYPIAEYRVSPLVDVTVALENGARAAEGHTAALA